MTLYASPLLFAVALAAEPAGPLDLDRTIPLPGVEGRFDHFAFDPRSKRVCLAALGHGALEVISLAEGKVAGEVAGLKEPQGVLVLPGTGEIAVAGGQDGTLKVFDGASLKLLHTIEVGEDADNVRFDAAAQRVYVGCQKSLAVVDAARWRKIAGIPLAAHGESFQLEKGGKRIFVNLPGAEHVAVVDREKGAVTATWKLDGASANFPMALDEQGRRLFIGARSPAVLLVYDIDRGSVVARAPIVGDADDVFFDARHALVYVIGGAGRIDVLRRENDRYVLAESVRTLAGARTGLFAVQEGRLYVAEPAREGAPARVLVYRINDR